MEKNLPIAAKNFRSIIRALYLVLRKEISKGKLLFDLNISLNHTKIANKLTAIRHNMFHHSAVAVKHHLSQSNIPVTKNDVGGDRDILSFYPKMRKIDVMMPSYNDALIASPVEMFDRVEESSEVKQVRISDSPFREVDQDYNNIHVDEAAEDFIMKFYQNLRKQN